MALNKETLQDGATTAANGSTIAVSGKAGVLLEVSGINSDTVTVEGKLTDTWRAIDSYALSGGGRSTTITGNGLYWVPAPGLKSIRARISTRGSGTITVVAAATQVPYGPVPS